VSAIYLNNWQILRFIDLHRHWRIGGFDLLPEDTIGIIRSFLGVIPSRLVNFKQSPSIEDDGSTGSIFGSILTLS
jgi:hypothetical protein